jgi:L-ascorbate metabolism protein UlaG (beta-lactamase superfamily)
MTMRFAILASGSQGNASYLEADGFGLLIDIGLGPRQLGERLHAVGLRWEQVRAVVLTHTHNDHWNDRTFAFLKHLHIPFYCHQQHHYVLARASAAFGTLSNANLVLAYEPGVRFQLTPRLSCLPFRVLHDSGLACGFRFEGPADLFGEPAALAYASDLGSWDAGLAQTLANVDVLAVEFNHDVLLQKNSRRSRRTIARNLGNRGHLSNEQAAALVEEVLRRSEPGRLRYVVQLHLSQECNRPELAVAVLDQVLGRRQDKVRIYTAQQENPGPMLTISSAAGDLRSERKRGSRGMPQSAGEGPALEQLWLPGWDEG